MKSSQCLPTSTLPSPLSLSLNLYALCCIPVDGFPDIGAHILFKRFSLECALPNYFRLDVSFKLIFNVDSVESCGRERYLVRILLLFSFAFFFHLHLLLVEAEQSVYNLEGNVKFAFCFAKIARRIWHRQMLWHLLLHFLT